MNSARACRIDPVHVSGLPALALCTAGGARAVVSCFGAQLLSWTTPNGDERLFTSSRAVFDRSRPIRGGVPICFPQFSDRGPLPRHGLVRERDWQVADQRTGEDYALVTLSLRLDPADGAPVSMLLEHTIVLDDERIDLELCVTSLGADDCDIQAALHTYLRVSEVECCALEGLYGFRYLDQRQDGISVRETSPALQIDGPIDRIYQGVDRPLLLRDDGRSLGIETNLPEVVVWNPWIEGAEATADLDNSDFRRMLCVEAAVASKSVVLPAGGTFAARQTLVVLGSG